MCCSSVTEEGRLREDYLPAMYMDANVLLQYFIAEEMIEGDQPAEGLQSPGFATEDRFSVLREILRAEKYTQKMIEIVERLEDCPRVFPVYTPLGLAELMGAYAKEKFKSIATQFIGNFAIERMSKKQVGDSIKAIFDGRRVEAKEQAFEDETIAERNGLPDGVRPGRTTTDLELLVTSLCLNHSFIDCNRFRGLILADVLKLDFTQEQLWGQMNLFAYLQLGLSDIMHIVTAKHLGCEYLASFDGDFKRASDLLYEFTGIKTLTSPDMIIDVL